MSTPRARDNERMIQCLHATDRVLKGEGLLAADYRHRESFGALLLTSIPVWQRLVLKQTGAGAG
jgi:hypothetical protein